MSASNSVGRLARRMSGDQSLVSWAQTPPNNVAGSHWERNILELAEGGDPRFVQILREHVKAGVIRGERAGAAINAASADASS